MSEQNIKTYTLEEVSQHSDVDSLWLIIHDDVYDVTKFASEHPGGVEILLDWAGQDATDGFEDANHSLDAREEMENYKIGELCQEDRGKQIETNDNNKWKCCKILIPSVIITVSAIVIAQILWRMRK